MSRNYWVLLSVVLVVPTIGCVEEPAGKDAAREAIVLEGPATGAADSNRGEISPGATRSGRLSRNEPMHYYDLVGLAAGDSVMIELNSERGDMFLNLWHQRDGRWELVSSNDDVGDSLNSGIALVAEAGRYSIGATTYQNAVNGRRTAASYQLGVNCLNESGQCGSQRGESCGSRGMAPCPEGQFCRFDEEDACGSTDRPGTCTDRHDTSTCANELAAEVCGCDGQTYASTCFAGANGASVAHPGRCQSGQGEGQTCGGIAGLLCAEGLRCNYSGNTSCGIADMAGFCEPDEPRMCTARFAPVCGCDGHTYSNDCTRIGAGVPLDHQGACAGSGGGQGVGETCGGIANLQCAEGLRCDYSGNLSCDIADAAGVCRGSAPIMCTAQYLPVCGCDGVTYSNNCMRAVAGVALDHTGACE